MQRFPNENVSANVLDFVQKRFESESAFRNEKIVGRWDLSRFLEGLRLTTVQVSR
jgi:hypothetical protein